MIVWESGCELSCIISTPWWAFEYTELSEIYYWDKSSNTLNIEINTPVWDNGIHSLWNDDYCLGKIDHTLNRWKLTSELIFNVRFVIKFVLHLNIKLYTLNN